MTHDKDLKEAVKAYIRKQIAEGNGGRIWRKMMREVKCAAVEQGYESFGMTGKVASEFGMTRPTLRRHVDDNMTQTQKDKIVATRKDAMVKYYAGMKKD